MNGALSARSASGLFAGLTDVERAAATEGLLALLRRRAALYTGGDSSSIPAETARELLASIEFTLREYLEHNSLEPSALARADLSGCLEEGRRLIEEKSALCNELWQRACLTAPAFASVSLTDTLRGIEPFWRLYDTRFFAHQIPCDIDYQLCVPVPLEREGVNYLNDYLRRLVAENDLLARFDAPLAERLLEAVIGDYKFSVANLFEPVFTNALGLALIGGDAAALDISGADRALISETLGSLGVAAPDALADAARALCSELGESNAFALEYAVRAARNLRPRISLAVESGGLEGVFPSI